MTGLLSLQKKTRKRYFKIILNDHFNPCWQQYVVYNSTVISVRLTRLRKTRRNYIIISALDHVYNIKQVNKIVSRSRSLVLGYKRGYLPVFYSDMLFHNMIANELSVQNIVRQFAVTFGWSHSGALCDFFFILLIFVM